MTKIERILALEAALCACEGAIPFQSRKDIQAFVDEVIKRNFSDVPFESFLQQQKDAVKKLGDSPVVFGAE
jgi:disulfide oxidoreductase YuzD